MVFPTFILRIADWLLYQLLAKSCHRAATKMKSYGFFLRSPFPPKSPPTSFLYPSVTKCDLDNRGFETLVCDIDRVLLRSQYSFFPYFMLVAFEAGSILRAFFLLLSCLFLWVLNYELKLKVMTFITFFGLNRKGMESVSRAVLPKFYLENLNVHAYDVWASTGCRVVFTSVPKVMVEGFLKEYMRVDDVVGTELQTFGSYFTGLVKASGLVVKHKALIRYFEENKPDIGLGTSSPTDNLFLSHCKVPSFPTLSLSFCG